MSGTVVLCLALALALASAAAKTNLKESILAQIDGDFDLSLEKEAIEGLEYELFNLTFPHSDVEDAGARERVKRWQQPNFPDSSLCMMTFNIRTYTSKTGMLRGRDSIIASVRFTELELSMQLIAPIAS